MRDIVSIILLSGVGLLGSLLTAASIAVVNKRRRRTDWLESCVAFTGGALCITIVLTTLL